MNNLSTPEYSAGQYEQSPPLFVPLVDGIIVSAILFVRGYIYWDYDLNLWLHIWAAGYLIVNIIACLFYYFFQYVQLNMENSPCNPLKACVRSLTSWILVMLCLLIIAYSTQYSLEYSRKIILSWFLLTPLTLLIWRLSIFKYLTRECNSKTVDTVVIGNSEQAMKIACFLDSTPNLTIKMKGYYMDSNDRVPQPCQGQISCLGNLDQCIEDARDGKFKLAYLCVPVQRYSEMPEVIKSLSDTTISLYFVLSSTLFPAILKPCWQFIAGSHAFSIYESSNLGMNQRLKRIEDIMLGSLILGIIAIPMLVIALLIKATSKGPVLFVQRRYGLNGKEFKMYKFRTMFTMDDGKEIKQATKNDPRVTPIGGFLRKFSLDELPQFLNVLNGDMSIVGPRPHAVAHNEEYRKLVPNYMLRHKVKPGITGLAQISGCRGETDTSEKMAARVHYDLEYIRSWTLSMDIKIILLTLIKGFYGENAY